MCGICGFTGPENDELLKNMTSTLVHRGPDDFGYYVDAEVSLGHRRLSIIDLKTGRQPIFNENKSVCVVFNGEIYNYLELRETLRSNGHSFTTNTDTEVIVHMYEEAGEDCVRYLNGIFAFALWDMNKKQLLLARDRLGVKPLYYSIVNRRLCFASEIKSVLANPDVTKTVDPGSLDAYLSLRYVPGEKTLLRDVRKLPPASIMVYKDGQDRIFNFWRLEVKEPEEKKPLFEYVEEFRQLIGDAVKSQLVSDVPFGAFISGGIDSAAIIAMMKRHHAGKIKTFTVGFGTDTDDFEEAGRIADYFDTDHHEIVTSEDAFRLLPQIIWHMDEPIGDPIIIPIYLLSREASQSVKMVLTGEGADEIFGSYVHHMAMYFGDTYKRYLNNGMRKLIKQAVRCMPPAVLNRFFCYPAALGKTGKERLLTYLDCLDDRKASYMALASVFTGQDKGALYSPGFKNILASEKTPGDIFQGFLDERRDGDILNSLIELDMRYWLSDYTLSKLDKLTMASSLEGRVPFLDHRLVEFCANIPARLKLNGLTTKFLLRKSMEGILPIRNIRAPKKAFYFPVEKCFGRAFKDYVDGLFDEKTVEKRGLFNYKYIKGLSRAYERRELLISKQLMSLVILENWMKLFID